MEFEVLEQPGATVVALTGELDSNTADEAQKRLMALVEAGTRRLVLDFAALDFVTSAGLRVLLLTTKRLRALGGELRVCHPNEAVSEVFGISGFDTLLRVFPTRDAALAAP